MAKTRIMIKLSNGKYIDMSKAKTVEYDTMEKARPTKYIKRVPKPSGKGYYYFYTREQVKDFQEKGIVPKEEKGGNFWDKVKSFFGNNADEKVNKLHEIVSGAGISVTKDSLAEHLAEYLNNKEKWDAKFRGEKKEKSEPKPKTESAKSEKKESGAKKEGSKWNNNLMKFFSNQYGMIGALKKEEEEKKGIANSEERDKLKDKFSTYRDKEIYNNIELTINALPDKYSEEKKGLRKWLSDLDTMVRKNNMDGATKLLHDITGTISAVKNGGELADKLYKDIKKQSQDSESKSDSKDNFETMPEGELSEHEQNTLENLKRSTIQYREKKDTFKGQENTKQWQSKEGLEKLHNEVKKDIPNLYPYIDKKILDTTGSIQLTEEGEKKFGKPSATEALKEIERTERFPEVPTYAEPPEGFKKVEGTTAPKGYEFYRNGTPLSKDYKKILVKDKSKVEALKDELGKKDDPFKAFKDNEKKNIEQSELKKQIKLPEVLLYGKIIDTSKVKTNTVLNGFFDRPDITFKYDGYFYLVDKESGIVLAQDKVKSKLRSSVEKQISDAKVDKARYESMIKEKSEQKNKRKEQILEKEKQEKSKDNERNKKREQEQKEAEKEAKRIEEEDRKKEKEELDKFEKQYKKSSIEEIENQLNTLKKKPAYYQDKIKILNKVLKDKKSGVSDEERSAVNKYEQAKQSIKDFEKEENKDDYTPEEWKEYLDNTEKELNDFPDDYIEKFKAYQDAVKNLSKYKEEALDASGQGKMFKALSNLRQEIMFKAQPTKYIKRIPNPKGQGYIYFYTPEQVKEYEKTGKLPDDQKKKPEVKESTGKGNIEILKESIKKVASIFADALSAKDAVQPTGQGVEQTGENIAQKSKDKKRLEKQRDIRKNTKKNTPEEKPTK